MALGMVLDLVVLGIVLPVLVQLVLIVLGVILVVTYSMVSRNSFFRFVCPATLQRSFLSTPSPEIL